MRNSLFILLLIAQLGALAQLSPYQPKQQLYEQASELFAKGQYGAALDKIDAFLASDGALGGSRANDLHARGKYIQAVCSYQLQRGNTETMLKEFTDNYSENSLAYMASYYLGKSLFNRKAFADAKVPLLDAYGSNALDQSYFDDTEYMLGLSSYFSNDRNGAKRYFESSSSRKGRYQDDAIYYSGMMQYEDGDCEVAVEKFAALSESKKYSRETMVYQGNCLLKLKRYEELYGMADELANSPRATGNNPQIFYLVANAAFETGNFDRATEFFGRYVLAKGKMDRPDYFRYGFAQYKLGNYAEAIPIFERAVVREDTLTQLGSYYLGFCFLKENDPASARFAFKKAWEAEYSSDPDIVEDALLQYAKLSFAEGEYDDALQALTRILEDYPDAPYRESIQTFVGEIYLYTRNYPRSVEFFESIPRTSDRAKEAYQTVCYFYGLELLERGSYPEARSFFLKAVQNDFSNSMALAAKFWVAEAWFAEKNYQKAIQSYTAYQQSPGASKHEAFAKATYGSAWSQFKLGNYSGALLGFEKYIAQAGNRADKTLLVDANLRAGDSNFLLRNYAKAIAYYQRVLDFRYSFRDYALYQMAESRYRLRNYQGSVKSFDELIRNFRDSGYRDDALDRTSEIYTTWIKDPAKAAEYDRILVNDYPQSPLAATAFNRMAIAAYFAGDTPLAVEYSKKVLAEYSDKKQAQIALENLTQLVDEAQYDAIYRDYRNRNPEVDENLATLVFNTGKDRYYSGSFESAISQFNIYTVDFKNGPDYFEVLVFRARSYAELGRNTEALGDYRSVYITPSNNDFTTTALNEAAEMLFSSGDYVSALSLYQRMAEVSRDVSERVEAGFGIGKVYKAMTDYDLAINTFRQIGQNNEAEVFSRTQANIEMGNSQYLKGDLASALATFRQVESSFKNAFGAESQYMIVQILYDLGKYEEVKEAGIYQKNQYPTFNEWKARTFLIVAEANYQLGEIFQAKGVLESLLQEERFPEIAAQARDRLTEIEIEEALRAGETPPETPTMPTDTNSGK